MPTGNMPLLLLFSLALGILSLSLPHVGEAVERKHDIVSNAQRDQGVIESVPDRPVSFGVNGMKKKKVFISGSNRETDGSMRRNLHKSLNKTNTIVKTGKKQLSSPDRSKRRFKYPERYTSAETFMDYDKDDDEDDEEDDNDKDDEEYLDKDEDQGRDQDRGSHITDKDLEHDEREYFNRENFQNGITSMASSNVFFSNQPTQAEQGDVGVPDYAYARGEASNDYPIAWRSDNQILPWRQHSIYHQPTVNSVGPMLPNYKFIEDSTKLGSHLHGPFLLSPADFDALQSSSMGFETSQPSAAGPDTFHSMTEDDNFLTYQTPFSRPSNYVLENMRKAALRRLVAVLDEETTDKDESYKKGYVDSEGIHLAKHVSKEEINAMQDSVADVRQLLDKETLIDFLGKETIKEILGYESQGKLSTPIKLLPSPPMPTISIAEEAEGQPFVPSTFTSDQNAPQPYADLNRESNFNQYAKYFLGDDMRRTLNKSKSSNSSNLVGLQPRNITTAKGGDAIPQNKAILPAVKPNGLDRTTPAYISNILRSKNHGAALLQILTLASNVLANYQSLNPEEYLSTGSIPHLKPVQDLADQRSAASSTTQSSKRYHPRISLKLLQAIRKYLQSEILENEAALRSEFIDNVTSADATPVKSSESPLSAVPTSSSVLPRTRTGLSQLQKTKRKQYLARYLQALRKIDARVESKLIHVSPELARASDKLSSPQVPQNRSAGPLSQYKNVAPWKSDKLFNEGLISVIEGDWKARPHNETTELNFGDSKNSAESLAGQARLPSAINNTLHADPPKISPSMVAQGVPESSRPPSFSNISARLAMMNSGGVSFVDDPVQRPKMSTGVSKGFPGTSDGLKVSSEESYHALKLPTSAVDSPVEKIREENSTTSVSTNISAQEKSETEASKSFQSSSWKSMSLLQDKIGISDALYSNVSDADSEPSQEDKLVNAGFFDESSTANAETHESADREETWVSGLHNYNPVHLTHPINNAMDTLATSIESVPPNAGVLPSSMSLSMHPGDPVDDVATEQIATQPYPVYPHLASENADPAFAVSDQNLDAFRPDAIQTEDATELIPIGPLSPMIGEGGSEYETASEEVRHPFNHGDSLDDQREELTRAADYEQAALTDSYREALAYKTSKPQIDFMSRVHTGSPSGWQNLPNDMTGFHNAGLTEVNPSNKAFENFLRPNSPPAQLFVRQHPMMPHTNRFLLKTSTSIADLPPDPVVNRVPSSYISNRTTSTIPPAVETSAKNPLGQSSKLISNASRIVSSPNGDAKINKFPESRKGQNKKKGQLINPIYVFIVKPPHKRLTVSSALLKKHSESSRKSEHNSELLHLQNVMSSIYSNFDKYDKLFRQSFPASYDPRYAKQRKDNNSNFHQERNILLLKARKKGKVKEHTGFLQLRFNRDPASDANSQNLEQKALKMRENLKSRTVLDARQWWHRGKHGKAIHGAHKLAVKPLKVKGAITSDAQAASLLVDQENSNSASSHQIEKIASDKQADGFSKSFRADNNKRHASRAHFESTGDSTSKFNLTKLPTSIGAHESEVSQGGFLKTLFSMGTPKSPQFSQSGLLKIPSSIGTPKSAQVSPSGFSKAKVEQWPLVEIPSSHQAKQAVDLQTYTRKGASNSWDYGMEDIILKGKPITTSIDVVPSDSEHKSSDDRKHGSVYKILIE